MNTSFEINYHGSQLINRGEDVFHNVDVIGQVDLLGESFDVMYQCGMWFVSDDVNHPSTTLALSDNSTDDFVWTMDQLTEGEIENFTDEDVAKYTEMFSAVKSVDDLLAIHATLSESLIDAKSEFESYKTDNGLSEDADMYVCDDGDVYARLKAPKDANDLKELIQILNGLDELAKEAGVKSDEYYDATSFPTFGVEPANTDELFSWDDSEVLLYGTTLENPSWCTSPRCAVCGEATFHCEHDED